MGAGGVLNYDVLDLKGGLNFKALSSPNKSVDNYLKILITSVKIFGIYMVGVLLIHPHDLMVYRIHSIVCICGSGRWCPLAVTRVISG